MALISDNIFVIDTAGVINDFNNIFTMELIKFQTLTCYMSIVAVISPHNYPTWQVEYIHLRKKSYK